MNPDLELIDIDNLVPLHPNPGWKKERDFQVGLMLNEYAGASRDFIQGFVNTNVTGNPSVTDLNMFSLLALACKNRADQMFENDIKHENASKIHLEEYVEWLSLQPLREAPGAIQEAVMGQFSHISDNMERVMRAHQIADLILFTIDTVKELSLGAAQELSKAVAAETLGALAPGEGV